MQAPQLLGEQEDQLNPMLRPIDLGIPSDERSTLGNISTDVSLEAPFAKYVQEKLAGLQGKTGKISGSKPVQGLSKIFGKANPTVIKNAAKFPKLLKLASVSNPVSAGVTLADIVTSEVTGDRGLYEMAGDAIGGAIGKMKYGSGDGFGENDNMRALDAENKRRDAQGLPALSASESVSFLNSMNNSEDQKVDNLQNALQNLPDTPQVMPENETGVGAPSGPQEAGQRLLDAVKEFYPNVPSPTLGPDAPTPEQRAILASQAPRIPESVTSSDVPKGLGPMQFIDKETGAPMDPDLVKKIQQAGFGSVLSQGAFPPAAPAAPVAPTILSEQETKQRLQDRFGAPTLKQIQSLPQGQARGTMVDAQGRMASKDRGEFDDASAELQARLADSSRRPGESQSDRDTRVANQKVTRGTSEEGRRYTDSELRRAFGDEGLQGARVKDMNGINPFTNQLYSDEELERQNLIADTEARERSNVDDPAESPEEKIEKAREFAEQFAKRMRFTPGTKEYDEYVNSIISSQLGFEYMAPAKRFSDDEADKAYERGELKEDEKYYNENDELVAYVPKDPEKTVTEEDISKEERRKESQRRFQSFIPKEQR